jgi:palmitoyltransferase ZDHHC6
MHFEVAMILINYYQCYTKDPGKKKRKKLKKKGSVPDNWNENLTPSDYEMIINLEKASNGKDLRFCETCKFYKPPRAHHSKELGKCIYRHVFLIY